MIFLVFPGIAFLLKTTLLNHTNLKGKNDKFSLFHTVRFYINKTTSILSNKIWSYARVLSKKTKIILHQDVKITFSLFAYQGLLKYKMGN